MKALRTALGSFVLALLTLAPSVSFSSDLTIPNTFIQGSPAVANEVNQNFSATAAAVNSKQDRVTGACPPGQAVRSVNQNGTVVCEAGLDARVTSLESLLNYMPVGPQTNVPQARVNLGGWTTCFSELYNNTTGVIANILASCNKANLMLACLVEGIDNTYTVLAQAPRADVTFATPSDTGTVHVANGTAWYFNTSQSWGFAKEGDAVFKNSCDTQGTNADQRLCWHTSAGNIAGGWRCGSTTGLNSSAAWRRVVLHRD